MVNRASTILQVVDVLHFAQWHISQLPSSRLAVHRPQGCHRLIWGDCYGLECLTSL